MSETIPIFDSLPVPEPGAPVEIFDPPMCCPTGLCGPALGQTLLDVNEMILALQVEDLHFSYKNGIIAIYIWLIFSGKIRMHRMSHFMCHRKHIVQHILIIQ